MIYRDAVGRVELPENWRKELPAVEFVNDLGLAEVERTLHLRRALAKDITAEFLLALPTGVRLKLLHKRTERPNDRGAAKNAILSAELRDEVAVRALIGEVRAYARATNEFQLTDDPDVLMSQSGEQWQVEEHAITAPDGRQLPRIGGSLAYWFGWYAFRPATDLFKAARAGD